jgi:glycerophosphoryl diester phosphodiesterase
MNARRAELVAHRGYAGRYPENTLPAVEAALRAGVNYIEVDVQLSADGVPVLMHDVELARTTGAAGRVTETTLAALSRLRAGETARLGPRFRDTPIPTLAALMSLLDAWPAAQVFVELKRDSLDAFGADPVVARVLDVLAPGIERCIVISFEPEALRRIRLQARASGTPRIGWVVSAWDEEQRAIATALAPDYLFCNHAKIPNPETLLWPGPWKWAFYEVADPSVALALAQRGASLIETMALDAYTVPPWSLRIANGI